MIKRYWTKDFDFLWSNQKKYEQWLEVELSENLCGLARIVCSAVEPAIRNVAFWHERHLPLVGREIYRS